MPKTSRLSHKHSKKTMVKNHGKKPHKKHRSSKHRYSGMLGDGCGVFNSVKESDVEIYNDPRLGIAKYFNISHLPCYTSSGEYVPKKNHLSQNQWNNFVIEREKLNEVYQRKPWEGRIY
jgi:hypothetical protein